MKLHFFNASPLLFVLVLLVIIYGCVIQEQEWSPQQIVEYITKDNNARESFIRYSELVGYHPEEFQIKTAVRIIKATNFGMCWSRRIGKTELLVHLSVFFAVWGHTVGWRCAAHYHLGTPKKYWLKNRLVTNVIGVNVIRVWVLGEEMIEAMVLTENNTRSDKADVMIFDELAFVPKANETAINSAVIMTLNSVKRHVIYNSTPRIDTEFEKIFKRLEKEGLTTHFNYHNVAAIGGVNWLDVEAIEKLKDTMPPWQFEQEQEAKFVAASGKVFVNILIEDSNDWSEFQKTTTHMGLDFNGSQIGDVFTCAHWSPDYPRDIYITDEGVVMQEEGEEYSLEWLRQYYNEGVSIGVETGGYNSQFAQICEFDYNATLMSTNPAAVSSRVFFLRRNYIHIDPQLTPRLLKEIGQARYAKNGSIYKTHSGQNDRNHALDSLINTFQPSDLVSGTISIGY